MPDIVIFKRRDRATMFAETVVGQRWMQDNLVLTGPAFTFTADVLEDMIQSIQKDDIHVEVK
jgi:hypothetical protein